MPKQWTAESIAELDDHFELATLAVGINGGRSLAHGTADLSCRLSLLEYFPIHGKPRSESITPAYGKLFLSAFADESTNQVSTNDYPNCRDPHG